MQNSGSETWRGIRITCRACENWSPTPQSFWFSGLRWGWIICISNKLPGDAVTRWSGANPQRTTGAEHYAYRGAFTGLVPFQFQTWNTWYRAPTPRPAPALRKFTCIHLKKINTSKWLYCCRVSYRITLNNKPSTFTEKVPIQCSEAEKALARNPILVPRVGGCA